MSQGFSPLNEGVGEVDDPNEGVGEADDLDEGVRSWRPRRGSRRNWQPDEGIGETNDPDQVVGEADDPDVALLGLHVCIYKEISCTSRLVLIKKTPTRKGFWKIHL